MELASRNHVLLMSRVHVREYVHSYEVACKSFTRLRAILLAVSLSVVQPIGVRLLCGGLIGALGKKELYSINRAHIGIYLVMRIHK
jgi:hypothetical protein